MSFDWTIVLVIGATSVLTAISALFLAEYLPRWPAGPENAAIGPLPVSQDETVFLFDNDRLIDATASARRLLEHAPQDLSDWARLSAVLSPRFPGFAAEMARLAETGLAELTDPGNHARLRAFSTRGIARIILSESGSDFPGHSIDAHSLAAQDAELETLRQVVAHMPTLAWQQDANGDVIWANRAYLKRVETTRQDGDDLVWPLPRLFDAHDDGPGLSPRRLSLTGADGDQQWFDCMAVAPAEAPMFFASPADAVVHAEAALRNFVQTLTKTFAGLPTGLAIFNRARNLVMFNPALVDLTHLEPQFLISRPGLVAFLDRLREKQMIPEPRDYKSWRQDITALEEGAAAGEYEATWTLSSGLTYRVTGRPHPDGAVAFLFEDISAEISLTRRFRAELEMGQAVLDSLDEAIAVFSPAGVLTMSNAAYAALWGQNPSESLSDIGIHDATRHWQDRSEPSNFWADARDFVAHSGARDRRETVVALADGRRLICQIRAIGGGGTLIGFRVLADHDTAQIGTSAVLA
ncbi:PAS-domain containing protein [Actibacterium sp.]|uniref:PAS-domain containing protein n=1 Tax=Actibacterium sp. TaxID=1872125 RepID=UPI00356133EE